MLTFLEGKKTYIVAGLMAIYALIGQVLHLHSGDQTTSLLLQAAALAGLRNGIAKIS